MFESRELQLIRKAVSHYITHGCAFLSEDYRDCRLILEKTYKLSETTTEKND